MRLWHKDLLHKLPKQWLMGQHRECCALRGNGWGKPHSVVNYVFENSYAALYVYHARVMDLLRDLHNVNIDETWYVPTYRGKVIGMVAEAKDLPNMDISPKTYYDEHNDEYLAECIENLRQKGIEING